MSLSNIWNLVSSESCVILLERYWTRLMELRLYLAKSSDIATRKIILGDSTNISCLILGTWFLREVM